MGLFDFKTYKLLKAASPITLTPFSAESLGTQLAACAAAAPASSAINGDANRAQFYPLIVRSPFVSAKFFLLNGATVAGNVDLGLFSEAYTLLTSTGSTAQSGTNSMQSFDVTDYYVAPGRYYLGISASDATATAILASLSAGGTSTPFGTFARTSLFPLATTTPESGIGITKVPVFGITSRTFVS